MTDNLRTRANAAEDVLIALGLVDADDENDGVWTAKGTFVQVRIDVLEAVIRLAQGKES